MWKQYLYFSNKCENYPTLKNICSFVVYCHSRGKYVYDDGNYYIIPRYVSNILFFENNTSNDFLRNNKYLIIEAYDEIQIMKNAFKTKNMQ